jgi:hypothetical protein
MDRIQQIHLWENLREGAPELARIADMIEREFEAEESTGDIRPCDLEDAAGGSGTASEGGRDTASEGENRGPARRLFDGALSEVTFENGTSTIGGVSELEGEGGNVEAASAHPAAEQQAVDGEDEEEEGVDVRQTMDEVWGN